MRRIIMFLLLVIIISISAISTTYYVSKDGNNSNEGTIENPWNTITYATNKLQPGDILYIREGIYHERLVLEHIAAEDAPILYSSFPGEYVEIDGISGELNVVIIIGKHITVNGLTVTNQNNLQIVDVNKFWVEILGKNNAIKNCNIVSVGDTPYNYWTLRDKSRAVSVTGLNNTIEDCYIRGQAIGIVITGPFPRFVTVRNTTIHSTGASNIVIQSNSDMSNCERIVQGNLIENCVLDTSWEEDNIQFESNLSDRNTPYNLGTIIRKTRMGHAAENCIDLKGAELILIDECLLYSSSGNNDGPLDGDDDGGGAGIELGYGDVSRYVIVRRCVIWDNHTGAHMYDGYRYYNNTFLNNRRSYRGPNCNNPPIIFSGAEIWNIPSLKRSFINNILGMQPNMGIYNLNMAYGSNFEINNNLYFDNGMPPLFYHSVTDNKTLTIGLVNWQKVLNTHPAYDYLEGKDINSIEANPEFLYVPDAIVDYNASWDFNLHRSSKAIDAGKTATKTVTTEYNSKILYVEDSRFFCDGFGITSGDVIKIGKSEPVHIIKIDYENNIIELEFSRTWSQGDGVHLRYFGDAPDIGAFESNYPSGIKVEETIPIKYELKQNYPNPFNSSTVIEYHLPKESKVLLTIHDTLGRVKIIMVSELQPAGIHKAELNGNLLGSSGPYFYVLQANKFTKVKKLLYIK